MTATGGPSILGCQKSGHKRNKRLRPTKLTYTCEVMQYIFEVKKNAALCLCVKRSTDFN